MDVYVCCLSEFDLGVFGTGGGVGESSGMDFQYVL